VNRSQLVKAVAAHTGQEAKSVDAALKGFTEVVTAVAAKGEPVAISGFAKFARVESKARIGRNPATGAPVKIPARKRVRVTALKGFKDAVLNPSTAPKLEKGVWPPAAAPAKKATPAKKAAPVKKAAPAAKAPAARATAARATAAKAPAAKAPAKKAPAKAPAKKAPAAGKAAAVKKR
jgi:DNA-binding protein HU-beta